MTRYDPSLKLNRMLVKSNEHVAYDETFGPGVNIIRGENSSGKSTILNFIFFGMGGDLSRDSWSEHALKCTYVWLEVSFNGLSAVLRREVDQSSMSPMEIFGGNLGDAQTAPIEEWIKYPYARSQSKESFSQAIFRLLQMPDVAVEGTSNVTVHQVLRILYADQLSPIDSLFRYEGYDPENLREAVGNLLCGAFDAEIYELQQLRRVKEKAFSEASAELKSIFRVVGGDESLGPDWVRQQRISLENERDELLKQISQAEEDFYASEKREAVTLTTQKSVYKQVQNLQLKLQEARSALDSIEFDISDSEQFILTLQRRQEALRDAQLAADLVEIVHFSSCPACFAEVLDADATEHACHLCKTPLDTDRAKERVVGLINEVSIQLKQSERLQEVRRQRRVDVAARVDAIQREWKAKARELSALATRPTSKTREKIRELHRALGYAEKSIEENDKQIKLANKIGDLSSRKASLDEEIQSIASRIDNLKRSQTDQLSRARRKIELETISMLKGDLDRQDSFENPECVDFSFAKNSITVDDHTYFSASSRVILKSSFLVGFLAAAIKDSSFRHPRFLMIDITEDKGMEVERSHNFQQQVLKLSGEAEAEHQVILATAMPAPQLSTELFIGKFSTRQSGTLDLPGRS